MNAVKLNWPSLTDREHRLILEELDNNINYAHKVVEESSNGLLNVIRSTEDLKKNGYYHLRQWPNHIFFLKNLFQNFVVTSKYFNLITIQKSINRLPPHTDVYRKFTIIYLVSGLADTVFYEHKFGPTLKKIFTNDTVTETERYRFEPYTWYAFCNDAIHAVENYSGERISLTFDLASSGLFKDYNDLINNIYNKEVLFRL